MRTTCVIAGGGPAGMMLGLLLARAGVAVTVLEKHADFIRDFRGDTVHASTVRLLDELGLGEAFRALPQSRLQNFALPQPDGSSIVVGDFGTLSPPYDYIAMVPQWDLLSLLADAGRREPTFRLIMETAATDLIMEDGRVVGLRTRTRAGVTEELRADLVVACDGRDSVLREAAGLVPRAYPVPFDTWWFRLPRHPDEPGGNALQPHFNGTDVVLVIPRTDYFQLAYFAAKGADARLRAEGVPRFRQRIADLVPQFADRVHTIDSMDDLHVLDVTLNRLHRWYRPGLLLIGDAAHAMSPAGGVGINLAVQDAVAAARILAAPLRAGTVPTSRLVAVQARRWLPMVILQSLQRLLHRLVFAPITEGRPSKAPTVVPVLARLPFFTRISARMLARGPLPEHAPAFARRPPAMADR